MMQNNSGDMIKQEATIKVTWKKINCQNYLFRIIPITSGKISLEHCGNIRFGHNDLSSIFLTPKQTHYGQQTDLCMHAYFIYT